MGASDSGIPAIADYTKLTPLILAALRLLGIYIVIVGTSTIVEDLARMISLWKSDLVDLPSLTLLDYISPRFLGDLAYLSGGMYLLLGGKWLIDNVFMPVTDSDIENRNDADESHA